MSSSKNKAPFTARALYHFYQGQGKLGTKARSAFREAFEENDYEMCLVLNMPKTDDVVIFSGGREVTRFNLDELRRDHATSAVVELIAAR